MLAAAVCRRQEQQLKQQTRPEPNQPWRNKGVRYTATPDCLQQGRFPRAAGKEETGRSPGQYRPTSSHPEAPQTCCTPQGLRQHRAVVKYPCAAQQGVIHRSLLASWQALPAPHQPFARPTHWYGWLVTFPICQPWFEARCFQPWSSNMIFLVRPAVRWPSLRSRVDSSAHRSGEGRSVWWFQFLYECPGSSSWKGADRLRTAPKFWFFLEILGFSML